ncbi:polysaccharide lyase family 7 protein [Gilvimarinus agarilyticus]|uniref:polysaccharide lyase family 7 protein n=1 Tax=Gilvimarinus sp. 2_MG-2023 TaxID=3062666 RepID=UPI001C09BED1|nr:polysaccharide lyase family 7 protein [Gilvimarinus sp. 2_MG-2023]MBU2884381.1 polysaccharide lyase family 7 protein [Gilvimarinus agarilyticus]MDO6569517.1 polysaccharide lyase family 7 protein [Gilvimarinus sp. 2_MG-2023]
MKIQKFLLASTLALMGSMAHGATFVMEKVDTGYAIDGNGGSQVGQQLYLWATNLNNVNQQWVQLDRGDGYYAYKKQNTNLCWDAGSGASRRQAVTLQTCDSNDYDQHFAKVKVYSGSEIYRFAKRNASGFSLDGNGGAADRQSIYLWNSNSGNINQQWELHRVDDGGSDGDSGGTSGGKLAIDTAFDDGSSHSSYPASKAVDGNTAWASRWAASGSPVNLTVQLEETSEVTEVGIAWGRGDSRAYTFEIYARPGTSGSWTKVYDDVSTGSTAGIEVFDITDIDAQQIRVKTFDNTAGTSWTNITEVEVYGSGGSGGGDNGGGDNGSGSGSDIPSNITNGSIFDLEGDDPNPLVNSSTLRFLPLEARYTSPNGNGWRHEYKVKSSLRVAMTDTYEVFEADVKVDMSDAGKTIVAQHHASDTGTIMKLYVSDSSESGFDDSVAGNGIFDVYVRLRNTSGNEEKYALGTIRSGDTFDLRVVNDYGYVTVYGMGNSFGIPVEDDSESYFKFGNYLQSQDTYSMENCGESGDSGSFADCFNDLGITESTVTMTNVTYTRITD